MSFPARLGLSAVLWALAAAWALAPHAWIGATLWHRGDHGLDVIDLPGVALALVGEVVLFGPGLRRRARSRF